jgi:aggrecan 1
LAAFKENLTTQGTFGSIQRTLGSIQGTFGSIQGTLGSIQGTLGSIQGTFGSIQGTFGSIQGTLGSIQGTLGSIQGTLGSIQGTFAHLEHVAGEEVEVLPVLFALPWLPCGGPDSKPESERELLHQLHDEGAAPRGQGACHHQRQDEGGHHLSHQPSGTLSHAMLSHAMMSHAMLSHAS